MVVADTCHEIEYHTAEQLLFMSVRDIQGIAEPEKVSIIICMWIQGPERLHVELFPSWKPVETFRQEMASAPYREQLRMHHLNTGILCHFIEDMLNFANRNTGIFIEFQKAITIVFRKIYLT